MPVGAEGWKYLMQLLLKPKIEVGVRGSVGSPHLGWCAGAGCRFCADTKGAERSKVVNMTTGKINERLAICSLATLT
jgi:hypothetical protein